MTQQSQTVSCMQHKRIKEQDRQHALKYSSAIDSTLKNITTRISEAFLNPENRMDPDCLNVLEQQPGLGKLYTQICLCYTVPDASSQSAIVNTLTAGLERLCASFPWIAGQVVNEGAQPGNTGIYKIKPLEQTPRLVVKDYSQDPDVPSMDALREAKFPFSMLDETLIAPRTTLHLSPDEPADWPVFLVQASFIERGLLLTFVGHHLAMDMTGQGCIISLLSRACRDEPFTSEDLSSGNIARRNLVPLLDDSYQPGEELVDQLVTPAEPAPSTTDSQPAPPPSTWVYFNFSASSLGALKATATKTMTLASGYISTDDTLSAFVWQSIVRARIPRLDSSAASNFARAVDVRRYLGVSPTYLGLLQSMSYASYPAHTLATTPLGAVASELRRTVDPATSNVAFRTRALATVLSRAADKNCVSFVARIDTSSGVMLSSWSKVNCYSLDFGLGLGMPECVRRPQFTPAESLVYFMPKARDGGIAVGLCLRDDDLERLKTDAEFAKYATFVG